MLNARWLLVPFVLHGICMGVDEFYFHWRRGLLRWERLGHPLDTLTVLVCQGWLWTHQPSAWTVGVYVVLCVFSSLFVTKDEFIHQKHCTAGEHWMQSLLFLLHPLVLGAAGLWWAAAHGQLNFIAADPWIFTALRGNLILAVLFGLYQLLFWNWLWQRLPQSLKIRSTIKSTTS